MTQPVWATQLKAIDPTDGELKSWVGPPISANTIEEAKEYCQQNELGYLEIIGQLELVEEIPYDDTMSADDHTIE